jgi:stage V sporulation protein B
MYNSAAKACFCPSISKHFLRAYQQLTTIFYNQMNKRQTFLQGAAILAVTVAVVKVLGAIYKIPLGNMLGDEGFANFSAAYRIYSVLLTLSVAGLPVAMSRLVANADANGDNYKVYRVFRSARTLFFVLGGTATAVMLLFSRQLASLLGNPDASASILALAPSVLFVCVMSAYRGYSQGLSNMFPTSITQVIETSAKLVVGLALAYYFVKTGAKLSTASAGAIAGVTAGAALALLYMVLRVKAPQKPDIHTVSGYRKRTAARKAHNAGHQARLSAELSGGSVLGQLLQIGIPIALGASAQSFISLIDTGLIMNRLQNPGGYTIEQAKVLYGVYSKVETLFNIPSSFIVPLTVSVIPAIASRIASGNRKGAGNVVDTALKLTTLLALPAAAGLSALAPQIVAVVYPGSNWEGAGILSILGLASFFVCVTLVTNAILQAYGHERIPVYALFCGGLAKVSCTYFLSPAIGIRGASIGTLASFAVISIINLSALFAKERFKLSGGTVKVVLATAVMGAVAYLGRAGLSRVTGSTLIQLCGSVVLAIIIYVAMVLGLRVITKSDLEFIPKGEKLAKLLKLK